jgi:hypothetical protein
MRRGFPDRNGVDLSVARFGRFPSEWIFLIAPERERVLGVHF